MSGAPDGSEQGRYIIQLAPQLRTCDLCSMRSPDRINCPGRCQNWQSEHYSRPRPIGATACVYWGKS